MKSFWFEKKFWIFLLLDVMFYLVIVGIFLISILSLQSLVNMLQEMITLVGEIKLGLVSGPSPELTVKASILNSLIKETAIKAIGIGVFIIVIIIASLCLFRGLIYSKLSKETFDKKFYLKFFALRLLWLILWVVILSVGFILKENTLKYFFVGILLVYIYFTQILNAIFNKNKKIFLMMKNTFGIGFKKAHKLFFSYFMALVAIVALLFIARLISFFLPNIAVVIIVIIMFIFFSWGSRLFIYYTIKSASG